MEINAPDICFVLIPDDSGVIFQTDHPNIVKLNEQSVRQKKLEQGDHISIINTLIHVDLMQ